MLKRKIGHGPGRKLGAIIAVLATILLGSAMSSDAQQASDQSGGGTASAEAINAITQTAVSLGVLTCAARVQQVTSFLGVTPQTRASIRRPANPPDVNSFSVAMTVATDGSTGIALADFYPVQTGCKANYSVTVNLPESCNDLRTTGFGTLTDENKLADNVTLLAGANTLRVMLIQSVDGCTVIKTETLD